MNRQAHYSLLVLQACERGANHVGKKVLRFFCCSWFNVSPEWGEAFRKLNLVHNWIRNSSIQSRDLFLMTSSGHLTFGL